jgi:hypothetical protein
MAFYQQAQLNSIPELGYPYPLNDLEAFSLSMMAQMDINQIL